MKTICYCIFCPNHPLFERREEFSSKGKISGWRANTFMPLGFVKEMGVKVDCLAPDSEAFDALDIDPEDIEWETCAYNDGCAETGYQGHGYDLYAYCENEEYELE